MTARATDGEAGPGSPLRPSTARTRPASSRPAQDRLHFAAFDVTATSRDELVALLQAWTAAAGRMTQGQPVGGRRPLPYDARPADTGEALGLPPVAADPHLRLRARRCSATRTARTGSASPTGSPQLLRRLPHFPADNLDPQRSDGDLCVQACADDPQVAVHAIRNLSRIAFGSAALRWAQLGFGRTSSTSTTQQTPRNLFGFKDGTANLKAESPSDIDEHVWVGDGDDPRRRLAGRRLVPGRPPHQHAHRDVGPDLAARAGAADRPRPRRGRPAVRRHRVHRAGLRDQGLRRRAADRPWTAHVRLAHPTQNNGARMLRRGYNFTDGNDDLGRLDAGLFFLAFVRDPDRQYIPMQNRLSRDDGLMEYLQHTGSGHLRRAPRRRARAGSSATRCSPDSW